MDRKPVIAIDGPAAAGKGTLSRKLAVHFDVPHLDTGLTYRAVGQYILENGLAFDDEEVAAAAALEVDLGKLDREILARHHIGEAASQIAVMPKVRTALVKAQRNFASAQNGAVLDGRDIGTVVLPQADVKLYITASPETRAKRRYDEILERGHEAVYQEIVDDIRQRDARDMERADSPLRPADDAALIDTSNMDIDKAFSEALRAISLRWPEKH